MQRQWAELSSAGEEVPFDLERSLQKTREKILPDAVAPASRQGRRGRLMPAVYKMAAAATGIVLMVASALYFFSHTPFLQRQHVASLQKVKTGSGEITLKVLADGTKIWLNAESSIEFPRTFAGDSIREVFLHGEAFFDVAEDKSHPFIVRTEKINIRVLGTAFNVKSYDQDPTVETTLVRGKVVIDRGTGGAKVELKPNQQAVFTHSTERITLLDVAAEKQISWNKGSLVFEDDTVYDVIKSLERWYGIEIHVQEASNMDCRLTAQIDKESLAQTLEMLKSIAGITYSIVGKDVFIKGKICDQ